MTRKYHVLDASAFMGGFTPGKEFNCTVGSVTDELKDLKSRMIMHRLIQEGKLLILEPDEEDLMEVDWSIKQTGDNLRLSPTDKKLLALVLKLKKRNVEVEVITDDYSIQNVLKMWNIPFKSILNPPIREVYSWKKICQGCKREYSAEYKENECEICGSKIYKKRFKSIN